MKTSITYSRSGHYTVTIHDGKKNGRQQFFKEGLISNLANARRIAADALAKIKGGDSI